MEKIINIMGRAFEYRRASKEKRWDKMSKLFPKLAKSITMAAKDGGSDPESNAKLRLAIANAKGENMPKDNIKKAIERASGKDAAAFKEITYEAKGPHGVLLYIECATDNTNRSITNVKTLVNKAGGQMMNSGSFDFMFSRKAVVEFLKTEEMDLEEIELNLIDSGLEELSLEEEKVYCYAELTDFSNLTKGVEEQGIEILKASLQRLPSNPTEFSEEQLAEIEELIDKLEDDEDVQLVFTNVA